MHARCDTSLFYFNIVATGKPQEERKEGEADSYEYVYEYEYEEYEDGGDGDTAGEGGDVGAEYELSSPPPTLSQLIPPTQSLEELLPKGNKFIDGSRGRARRMPPP